MKTITSQLVSAAALVALAALTPSTASGDSRGFALGTSFTHDVRFNHHGAAAEGVFDFEFELYDQASEGKLLGHVILFDRTVTAGALTTELDFRRDLGNEPAWLEIHVRESGSGVFTKLTPRQKLTDRLEPCAVDGNLVVEGSVDCEGNLISHNDGSGAEVTGIGTTLFGHLTLRNGGSSHAFIDSNGHLGIGTIPTIPLNLVGGGDLTLGYGTGQLLVGSDQQKNIVFDANEIQARNAGSGSDLHLNHEGGKVILDGGGTLTVAGDVQAAVAFTVAGKMDPKFTLSTVTCAPSDLCTATCSGGRKVLSGGCSINGNNRLLTSIAVADNQWQCKFKVVDPSAVTIQVSLACADVY